MGKVGVSSMSFQIHPQLRGSSELPSRLAICQIWDQDCRTDMERFFHQRDYRCWMMLVDPKRNCHRYIHPTGPIFVNKNVPGVFMACASATNNISTGFTGEEINDCVTSDGIDPTSKTERGHSVGPNRRDICRVSSGCPSIALLKRRCRCCFLAMWMKS